MLRKKRSLRLDSAILLTLLDLLKDRAKLKLKSRTSLSSGAKSELDHVLGLVFPIIVKITNFKQDQFEENAVAKLNHRKQSSESGQVMVVLAISFVAILGFVALAIDGGMTLTDRRHAQSAADAASLAGGSMAAHYMRSVSLNYNGFVCNTSGALSAEAAAETAAITQASLNDYLIDTDVSDKHGVDATCEISDLGSYQDKHIDILTKITRDTETNFAHLVYEGPLRNEVEAVVRVYPPAPLAFGKAIIALNEDACSGNKNGVIFSGSSDTTVTGGGVWSNGCFTGNGTEFTVTVHFGEVGFAGTSTGTLTNIVPAPEHIAHKIPDFSTEVNEPSCAGLPDRTMPHSGPATIEPGVYDSMKWTGGDLTMQPGLYCVSGTKGVEITGGSIYGDGVTLYLQAGGVDISGNVMPVDLRAPVETPDPAPAVPGILIYLAHGNDSVVSITGNSTSFYLGTIYAPDGDLYISGSSGTHPTFNTQLIGYNVEVSGGATIDINFNDDENFEQPPYMDLLK